MKPRLASSYALFSVPYFCNHNSHNKKLLKRYSVHFLAPISYVSEIFEIHLLGLA